MFVFRENITSNKEPRVGTPEYENGSSTCRWVHGKPKSSSASSAMPDRTVELQFEAVHAI